MIDLVLGDSDAGLLESDLLRDGAERCALLYVSEVERSGRVRLLVRDLSFPADEDYLQRSAVSAVLRPQFVAMASRRARSAGVGLVFVHSHLGPDAPRFSLVDDQGERELAGFLARRNGEQVHAALVISRGGARARRLGSVDEIRVITLGGERRVTFDPEGRDIAIDKAFDRQVRLLGIEGQSRLASLTIAIVGLGGTGSIAAQELVHLGVRHFVLVDPDVIEETNLNRVLGAAPSDLGRPKVDVARDAILRAAPRAVVECVNGDITKNRYAQKLTLADAMFGCTDSHGSRAMLQQVAYQYLIPCIDMGSTITASAGEITGIFGRVQLLSPGQGCLTCCDLLDPERVRRDMMSGFERMLDPYVQGSREPAPAVISLNGTIVSLAITMFLACVAGLPSPVRYLIYDAKRSLLRSIKAIPKTDCYICSPSGVLGRGDSTPLYGRQD